MSDHSLTPTQVSMLAEFKQQCDQRGWFFYNCSRRAQIEEVLNLEQIGRIKIQDRDIRIDHVSGRVKAGEIVGTLT